ncbi:hypothetical protein SDC9_132882 [bioreactor metagenome]|uniref:Uncharacterized protein n=1 Tax=bioreactor metagenome TaxID=1076179 RepID=A0A645D8E1_9ZZZZ
MAGDAGHVPFFRKENREIARRQAAAQRIGRVEGEQTVVAVGGIGAFFGQPGGRTVVNILFSAQQGLEIDELAVVFDHARRDRLGQVALDVGVDQPFLQHMLAVGAVGGELTQEFQRLTEFGRFAVRHIAPPVTQKIENHGKAP